jgi:hypothetical protein
MSVSALASVKVSFPAFALILFSLCIGFNFASAVNFVLASASVGFDLFRRFELVL